MTSVKPVLYSYWRSSCSWRVRIALSLKGIEYDTIPVNLLKNEHTSPEYIAKNPRALVPSLAIGDTILTESLAIIEYLEEKYPETPKLLPGDPEERAKIRALALMVAANTQPLQNLTVLKAISDDAEEKKKWAQRWIHASFDAIEKELAKSGGKYSVGDDVTLADVCLVPQVYNANRFEVDMSKYPNIKRVNDALLKVAAFQKAHPDNQPDAVKE